MTKIYLTRHGQDQDNAAGLLNGHRNTPLTDLGLAQAGQLADFLQKNNLEIKKIYTSPLLRAKQTAAIVGQALDLQPQENDLLKERDFGLLTGQKIADVKKLCAPDIIETPSVTYFLKPQNGEDFPQLLVRAKKFLSAVQKETDNILVVCHSDTGKMLYAAFYDLDWQAVLQKFHFGNTEVIVLDKNLPSTANHKIYQTAQHNA